MKIVIASSGRRAHYVEMFQDALQKQGIAGDVVAMEYRANSPSMRVADQAVSMPAYNSAEYPDALRSWAREERPDLFFSINDYELRVLAHGLADELRELGCAVGGIGLEAQALVLDKYRMAEELEKWGIASPETALGTEVKDIAGTANGGAEFVVKHRFGSGSSGLHITDAAGLEAAVTESAETALDQDGKKAPTAEMVIVQERLPGDEFGVDGVFTMDGTAEVLGVVARRKVSMRDGDTDESMTVEAGRFREAIGALGQLIEARGSIDVDFKEDAQGVPHVIDINPRFGGGYPFCHAAGADAPSALVRHVAGLEVDPTLFEYTAGLNIMRRDSFTVLGETPPLTDLK